MSPLFVLCDVYDVVVDPIGLVVLYAFAMIVWGWFDRRSKRSGKKVLRPLRDG